MKRFYKEVSTAPAAGDFAVVLDGKPVRTPANQNLAVPTQKLAQAIAAEWRAQEKDITPETMPLMRLATTALDHFPARREETIARLVACADTDLLCLREDQDKALRAQQDAAWQPPLDWLKATHDIALQIGEGLKPPKQSQEARAGFERIVGSLNDWELIGLSEAAAVTGSLVLALALKEAALSSQKVFELAELESLHQVKRWGQDAEAQKRFEAIQGDLNSLAQWFELISD